MATCGGFEDNDTDCSSEHSSAERSQSPDVDVDIESDDDDVVGTQPSPSFALPEAVALPTDNDLPDWVDDEELDMWCETSNVIRSGMCFKGKQELIYAIRKWHVAQNREMFVVDSTKSVFKAMCYTRHRTDRNQPHETPCKWLVRASKRKNNQFWQIYMWVESHNCYGSVIRNNNRSLKSSHISLNIAHFVREKVVIPVKQVQVHIKNELRVDVSYQKAWHGRRKAIESVYGNWVSNFDDLPRYIAALQASNPGTVVEWKHHENSTSDAVTFKYVFWCFEPARRAFQRCHPVFCVDGTHLKGSYRGKLLTAVTKDANNHILPIAYAIVDEETVESWCWFFEQFRWSVANLNSKPLCVISDRHKGIIHAMENLPDWKDPYAYHRFCLRHVRSNLMARFKMSKLKKICWGMGSTTQRRKYKWYVGQMREANEDAWNYLKEIDRRKWSLLYDREHRRWGNLTTNIAESMNNALRAARLLPIKACIEYTFNKAVQHFRKHSEIAQHCDTELPPRMWRLYKLRESHAMEHTVEEYNYVEAIYAVYSRMTTNDRGGNDYTVHFEQRNCTCGKWQMTRFPCSHAIAVCHHRGAPLSAIVDEVYTTMIYRLQYRSNFQPLAHRDYWTDPGWKIQPDFSKICTSRGRRRARRIPNEMDASAPDEPRIRRCTVCHQPGHNRTTCPNSHPSFDLNS